MSTSPLQTGEELQIVKECTILPILLDVLEKDIRSMETSGLTDLYIGRLREIQRSSMTRLSRLKNDCRARSITIMETHRKEYSLLLRYRCRGYQHHMELQWDFVRADIEQRLAKALHISLE
ncbi:hypothetical protein SAMN05661091_4003 [Paenibacillus uliginis N3/975]|uniref:Uncharacterized protein n=1 Tax=Paenibacillus uliginis N3/975 TaxID=1313296 RepID=A0A1X7HLC0_9BACL|nr:MULTISPECIES: hypothetical protein [Paenibacillus]UNK20261.1 hypothetical protein MNQ98_09725 [Paenibacillus sp. N3/727]SMF87908.1 hypothetical protein SAMN05661091_4003 [Paenibacillus uliginis N3/975]